MRAELTVCSSNGDVTEEPVTSRRRLNSNTPLSLTVQQQHQSNGLSNGSIANGAVAGDDESDEQLGSTVNSKEEGSSQHPVGVDDDNSIKEDNNGITTTATKNGKNGKIGGSLGSDEEPSATADLLCADLTPDQMAKRAELVNRLQVQLRTEEMKLVLLKKLKQSQVRRSGIFCFCCCFCCC